ncbi:transposase, partial [Klebsiella pneumoniae]
ADRNRSHWSTSKTPSYTKSVSWQHHPYPVCYFSNNSAVSLFVTRQLI